MTYTVPPGRYSDTSADFIQAYIDQSIQDLVGASPESLDTLQELADALGDNPDAINNLVANLQAEIDRAQAAEEALQAELNAEEAASAAYDVQQDNRISILEIVNEINKKELSYITLVGTASPATGQVGVNSFTPSAISMIVLPKTDADGKTIVASDFLEGDRIGLKQTNGSAAIYFVEDSFDFGDHVRMNVDDTSTVLGAAGDQLFVENDSVNAVFEDTSVTRAAATAGFTAASDARAILQGLIDALEARADALELDPTTQTAVDTINSALSARLDTLEADPTTATAVAAGDAATLVSANTYTDTSITNLVNGADAALDTLKEIGDALAQGDTDVTTALTTQITTEATTRGNADTALSGRLDVLEADPTTATAVAAVQSDVDQNESDADAADAALSGRLDVLEADPTTATAVAAVQADVDQNESDADAAIALKLNTADPAATGALTVDTNARLQFDSNLTKIENVLRGTGINIGNNIEMRPAASGGRVEITGDLLLDASDLVNANNDTDAGNAGTAVGGIYHHNGVLRIRLS